MKLKQRASATVPEAIVYFLVHGTYAPTTMPGAFEAFQLARDYEGFRPYWQMLRAEILERHPDAWGRRFDE